MPQLFEKQDRESEKAFAAFSLYLSLGPQRSLAEVAHKLHKSVTMLGRWSAKFDWPARVAAHGAHLAIVEREAIEAAKRGLDAYMAREKVYANLADIARMLEIASKLGRLATGLDKSNGETNNEPQTLRVEVTVALEKIYGQTEVLADGQQPKPAIIDVETVPPTEPKP